MHGLCWMLEIIRTRLTKTWGKVIWKTEINIKILVKSEDKRKSFLTFKDSKVFPTYPFWRGYLSPHSRLTRVKTKRQRVKSNSRWIPVERNAMMSTLQQGQSCRAKPDWWVCMLWEDSPEGEKPWTSKEPGKTTDVVNVCSLSNQKNSKGNQKVQGNQRYTKHEQLSHGLRKKQKRNVAWFWIIYGV